MLQVRCWELKAPRKNPRTEIMTDAALAEPQRRIPRTKSRKKSRKRKRRKSM